MGAGALAPAAALDYLDAMGSSSFAAPAKLLVRPISSRFAECLRSDANIAIDVDRARTQHRGYVEALERLGLVVESVEADDDAPDACFLEDTAVVMDARSLATMPGAPARRREVEPVTRAVRRLTHVTDVIEMQLPATLDGGDVLRVGEHLFVGLSSRTNAAGAAALELAAKGSGIRVVRLTVRDGLHLKSACTLASAGLLVYDARVLGDEELACFLGIGLRVMPAPEAAGANVLALGGAVLVSLAAPKTAELLRAEGLDVHVVDVGEMHKADGALTCLSLRIPRAGCWST